MKKLLFFIFVCIISLRLIAQESVPIETVLQKGHLEYVTCATFSPDGKYILTGSYDNTIKLWNTENRKEIRAFRQHTEKIRSVTFSPDGKYFLSASADNSAIIFDVLIGKQVQIFNIEKDNLIKAIYSPDGSKVLTMINRDEVTVWDVTSGRKLGSYRKNYSAKIFPSMFSPDSKKLLSVSNYKESKIVNIDSGKVIRTLPFDKTYSMAYSPDGKYIALGSSKLFSKVFDAETGKELHRFKDDEEVRCDGCNTLVTFSNSSKYLLTGCRKAGLTLWDIKKGTKVRTYKEYKDRIRYIKFSPHDKYILSAGDRNILVFNLKTGTKMLEIKNDYVEGFEPNFSPDDKYIIAADENNTAVLWDIAKGRVTKTYEGYLNKKRDDGLDFFYSSNWITSNIIQFVSMKSGIALSPDGKYIVKGNIDSIVIMIDIATGKIVNKFIGHSKVVYNFDFSPDGKTLITAGGDNFIKLWDVKTAKEIRTIRGHTGLIFDIKFNSDGEYIVSASWDGTIRIWETSSGNLIQYIKLEKTSPCLVGFTPNDLYVISGDLDKKLKLWEVDAGEEFRTFIGLTDMPSSFTFSPDAKTMVSGCWDGKAKIWDALTGMQINKFNGHRGSVYSVAYDPQGRFVASGSSDRTIKLWDPNTGKEIKTLEGHSNSVTAIKITPDGKNLISCSADGEIKVWDLDNYIELYTYLQIGRNDWLVKNPAGYFDGSQKAIKLVNYVSGMEVITVGSFFEKYFTPGLLKRIMNGETFEGTGDNLNEMIKTSPKVSFSIMDAKKRNINIVTDSIYRWKNEIFPITINMLDQGIGLDEIRIYNNGKLILKESLSSGPTFRGGDKLSRSFDIQLSDGNNKISAIVLNKDRTESFPVNVEVYYDGEAAKTDLFLLAIGINKYKNPAYELSYAVNDAKSYAKLIKKDANSIFNNVEEYFIKDSEASKEGIISVINQIISKIGPEDVFLFYYAGHGVMGIEEGDEPSDFYIVTYDITNLYGDNEMLQKKAISASELMEFSRQISAEKQLFILDACQSGGALNAFAKRGAGREKALAQLARSTGTFFLTAAQDAQYANEVSSLQHGVFTYAIIEALEGKADGGMRDEKITVNELKSYVEDRVPELSEKYKGSPQYPTSYSFGQDFPIVIVK